MVKGGSSFVLAGAIAAIGLASAAYGYDPTYSISITGNSSNPTILMPGDPNDDYRYDVAYYTPTAENRSAGALHVILDPNGPEIIDGVWVMGWLRGDLANLNDVIVGDYVPTTQESNPVMWNSLQDYLATRGKTPFNYLWRFNGTVPEQTSFDFVWDVGPDVWFEQIAVVPEPSSLLLFGLGALALTTRRR